MSENAELNSHSKMRWCIWTAARQWGCAAAWAAPFLGAHSGFRCCYKDTKKVFGKNEGGMVNLDFVLIKKWKYRRVIKRKAFSEAEDLQAACTSPARY